MIPDLRMYGIGGLGRDSRAFYCRKLRCAVVVETATAYGTIAWLLP